MAQQTLHTVISIGGRVDNSFGALGESLIVLGSQIDQISQKAINFGKESLLSYASYDDAMREAQAAGKFTATEMERLDELNRQIAQTSIYSNTEAANAMAELVKRGYGLEEVETMLPSVLDLAMAGNLELSDSVDYLGTTLKALHEDATFTDDLADMMTVASDISASDIDTLGESIMRLGSGVGMFRGGAKEVLTFLTAISDFGEDMQGTQGGTALRNFALSLIAPAGQGKEVLAALENFGMTQAELQEYMEDEDIEVTAAAAAIEELGLQVFDAEGNLRSMYDILVDLDKALDDLDDSERIPVLREIFGRRGYATAENLMATLPDYWGIYNQIADSEGAAMERSAITQGGVGGALREFSAAYEEFKTSIGEQISPEATAGIDLVRGLMTDISNMDEAALAALVGGMEGIAAVGPGLMIAGGGMRLLGNIFGTKGGKIAGAIAVAAIGIGALASGLEKVAELNFEEKFGDMELNHEAITGELTAISENLSATTEEYDSFRVAVEGAVTAYTTASSSLSSELLTAAITGNTLTDNDKERLMALGNEMYAQLVTGIENSAAASMEYYELLFGGEGAAEYNPAYQDLYALVNQSYEDSLAEAKELSEGLRSALTSAFDDGQISPEEYEELLDYFRNYNEAMAQAEAEAANEEALLQRQMLLNKAQAVSFDSAEAALNEISAARLTELATMEEAYQREYAKAQLLWKQAIADETYLYGELATQERMDASLAGIAARHQGELDYLNSLYDPMYTALFDALIGQSEYRDTWAAMARLANFEGATTDELARYMAGMYSDETLDDIDSLAGNGRFIDMLGKYAEDNPIAQGYLDIANNALEAASAARAYKQEELMTGKAVDIPVWMTGADKYTLPDPSYFDAQAENAHTTAQESMYALPPLTMLAEIPGGAEDAAAYNSEAQSYLNSNPLRQTVQISFSGGVSRTGLPSLSLPGMDAYAEGGRADEPSIFGDAGAEWAIPEAHDQNTADLLNAAREASGFSWPDLISRTSGGSGSARPMIYAPTIYARDARDVEEKLMEDKRRFERWWDERQLRDEIEVYR
ncbi:MAG: phage tail tape measure protein [Clostridia bacterium]|nr:phage tail tape measure protein [Clostridia bacterium]